MASSASAQVCVFQDFVFGASSPFFSLSQGWGTSDNVDLYYGGTTCSRAQNSQSSFTTNQTTELRLFGICGPGGTAQVQINEAASYSTPLQRAGYQLAQLYQTPPFLPGSSNNVTITTSTRCCFDLILIAPTPDAPLSDQTLMVDDAYSRIEYLGSWHSSNNETYLWLDSPPVYATTLMNTTHSTSTVGDTMRFSYTGTNLTVFGSTPESEDGNFTISYSIDDGKTETSSFTNGGGYKPNVKLVDTGPLPAGNHTVTITLTTQNNLDLVIDYILYTPAFNTLAQIPNTAPQLPSGNTSSTAFPAGPTGNDPIPRSRPPLGPIIGGTGAGLALLIATCLLIFCHIRRRKRRRPDVFTGNPTNEEHTRSPRLKQARGPRLPFVSSRNSTSVPQDSLALSDMAPTSSSAHHTDSVPNPSPSAEPDAPPTDSDGRSSYWRRRAHELTAEVEHLRSIAAPPAYSAAENQAS